MEGQLHVAKNSQNWHDMVQEEENSRVEGIIPDLQSSSTIIMETQNVNTSTPFSTKVGSATKSVNTTNAIPPTVRGTSGSHANVQNKKQATLSQRKGVSDSLPPAFGFGRKVSNNGAK